MKNTQNSVPQGVNPVLLNQLLSVASQKLGCTPTELRQKLENGEFEAAVKSSNPTTPQMMRFKQMLGQISGNPSAAQKLMNDPKAAEILKKLSK